MKKNKTKKRRILKKRGGNILGSGTDGCIVDSIECDEFNTENGYVAKILYPTEERKFNGEINDKLAVLDPENLRFNRYYIVDKKTCTEKPEFKEDAEKCTTLAKFHDKHLSSSKSSSSRHKRRKQKILFQRRLEPLKTDEMTKSQYRHLKKSIEILHENDISHGDLLGNVMMHPETKLPVIIDWETAKLFDEMDKSVDRTAFFHTERFRIKKN
jgi:thiamine kinase-like enzyme